MESTASNKRRKPSPDLVHITELPDTVLAFVATFLPKLSQAVFAVAMEAPSSAWKAYNLQRQPSVPSNASIPLNPAEEWASLDFEDIDKSLAAKLTDDDLGSILIFTDAANRLERLKLTGLLNITGTGLEPLRGSVVLRQIDLSLLKLNETPSSGLANIIGYGHDISLASQISEEVTLPILDSIVNKDGNKLKHMSLPSKWYHNGHRSQLLDQFMTSFNNRLSSRPFECKGCDDPETCLESEGGPWFHINSSQEFTCYTCLNSVCNNSNAKLRMCNQCEKRFCSNCDPREMCGYCAECYCKTCSCMALTQCDFCEDRFCGDCHDSCDCCSKGTCHRCHSAVASPVYECHGRDCNKQNCPDCEDPENVHNCRDCEKSYCFDCLCSDHQESLANGTKFCNNCAGRVVTQLLEDKGRLINKLKVCELELELLKKQAGERA